MGLRNGYPSAGGRQPGAVTNAGYGEAAPRESVWPAPTLPSETEKGLAAFVMSLKSKSQTRFHGNADTKASNCFYQTHSLGAATPMVILATSAFRRPPAEGVWVKTTGANRFASMLPVG